MFVELLCQLMRPFCNVTQLNEMFEKDGWQETPVKSQNSELTQSVQVEDTFYEPRTQL